jgi:trehalose synthase
VSSLLEKYGRLAGDDVIEQLQQLSAPLKGAKVVHVNSTRHGGGVAEILGNLIPLMRELEIDAQWKTIAGSSSFYRCTKSFHDALQGRRVEISPDRLRAFEETNARNAEELRPVLEEADVVFIHDPQPAPLLGLCPRRKGKWVWRCHIDISRPFRQVWRYLRDHLRDYDASIFSLASFAQPLPHPQYLIPPSIDALSEKNVELPRSEISAVRDSFQIDAGRPLVLQVSRFDQFKDPLGVLHSYRLAKRFIPALQLVLAGGAATDDPDGESVLQRVTEEAGDDPDVHVLLLPSDSHRTVNALQRSAEVVLQKSLREGFGLTVAEALWKGKPVIGGDTGGIRLQVVDYQTGFLVNSAEGAALRLRYLLRSESERRRMGNTGRDFVLDNFLLTRHAREYLTLKLALLRAADQHIELWTNNDSGAINLKGRQSQPVERGDDSF